MKNNKYFDNDKAHKYLIILSETNKADNALIEMAYLLYNQLLNKQIFKHYSAELKEDMVSMAIFWLIKYGHNYKPDKVKSNNGAFTYMTYSAEMAFRRVLTDHYKHVNIEQIAKDAFELMLLDNDEVDSTTTVISN